MDRTGGNADTGQQGKGLKANLQNKGGNFHCTGGPPQNAPGERTSRDARRPGVYGAKPRKKREKLGGYT